jgi:hypothetical protein
VKYGKLDAFGGFAAKSIQFSDLFPFHRVL